MPHTDESEDEALSRQLRRALRLLPDAPPALQRRAIDLWRAPAPGLAQVARAALNHITAVLSFDSWKTPALASGMRSLRSPTRQLLFSASGRDIDLRITVLGAGYAVAGQILGPDESGQVELARLDTGAEPARQAALDALGEFRIEGLAPGSYALTLQLGGDEIVLPPIDVGEQAR